METESQNVAKVQATLADPPPPPSQGKGAPKANRNAATHGLRMVNSRLPDGAAWIRRETDTLKRHLESLVLEAKGELAAMDAAGVNEAIAWERHRLLAARWLRLSCDDMNHDQRLSYSREVARAASERNKALRMLGIDKRDQDPWSKLNGILDVPEAPNATASHSVAQEGD